MPEERALCVDESALSYSRLLACSCLLVHLVAFSFYCYADFSVTILLPKNSQ